MTAPANKRRIHNAKARDARRAKLGDSSERTGPKLRRSKYAAKLRDRQRKDE